MHEKGCGCEKCGKKSEKGGKGVMVTIASVRRLPMPAKKGASKKSSKPTEKEEKPY
jgi:hypothetical protein